MSSLFSAFVLTLTSLVPIMNPLSVLPIFASLTQGMDARTRNRTARRTATAVLVVTVIATLAGRPVLHALGISLPALQVAGGLVVGATGFAMVTGSASSLTPKEQDESGQRPDPSVVPLAIPLVSGPGAIGVLVALSSREPGVLSQAGIAVGCLVMAAVLFVVLRFGDALLAKLGTTGLGIMTRLFGLAVLAVAIELATKGLLQIFPGLAH